MSENVCSCGKPGDKKCSKCKIACYCSRECQVADFPKHKRVCKILAKMNLNSSPENITLLPTLCSKIPLPKLPPSSPVLPLEPLLPFFLLMATMHLQCEDADWFSPVHDMLKINNNLIALVANVGMEPKSKLYTFNPFKRFYQGGSESAEHAKTAYLMMTFNGKCCELACCFGQLVLKAVQSHVMTYGGERVVGWALQDGHLDISHPSITQLEVVNLRSEQELAIARNCINTGERLPFIGIGFGRNSDHTWLTFVTETGRIFDLDLSALQFGTAHLPFPCVVPVTSATAQTTFAGMCTRHRILSTDLPTLDVALYSLAQSQADGMNSLKPEGAPEFSVATWDLKFENINQKVLQHAHTELPKYAADPDRFWTVLWNL